MQTAPKRVFTREVRAEAVKLVLAEGLGVTSASRKLCLSVKTYSKWIRDARAGLIGRGDAHRAVPVTDLQAEVNRLKRELAIACEERDILKKATATLRSGPSEVPFFQDQLTATDQSRPFSVNALRRVLEVSRSGFYEWQSRRATPDADTTA